MSDELHEHPVTTGVKQGADTKFKPGQSGNPRGRPKGARHRLGEAFIQALQKDFEEHGAGTIVKVREERPHEYLKVVASLLPKELNVRTTEVEELSDDELAGLVTALQSVAANLVSANARARAGEAQSAEPAQGIPTLQ